MFEEKFGFKNQKMTENAIKFEKMAKIILKITKIVQKVNKFEKKIIRKDR